MKQQNSHTPTVTHDTLRTLEDADNPAADVARLILAIEDPDASVSGDSVPAEGHADTPAD